MDPSSTPTVPMPPTLQQQLELLFTLLSQLRDINAALCAAMTWLVYEWIICFCDEVRVIWRSEWSIPKVLYLWFRYFGMIDLAISTIITTSVIGSFSICKNYFRYLGFADPVSSISTNILLAMRVQALYSNHKRVIFVVWAWLCVDAVIGVTIAIVSTTKVIMKVDFPLVVTGCLYTGGVKHAAAVQGVATVSAMLVHVMFLILTLYKSITVWRGSMINTPLLKVFVRDGVFIFFAIFSTYFISTVTNWVWQSNPLTIITSVHYVRAVSYLMAARLVLNLRKFNDRQLVGDDIALTKLSTLKFQPPRGGPSGESGGDSAALTSRGADSNYSGIITA